jgi:hypothetical protein
MEDNSWNDGEQEALPVTPTEPAPPPPAPAWIIPRLLGTGLTSRRGSDSAQSLSFEHSRSPRKSPPRARSRHLSVSLSLWVPTLGVCAPCPTSCAGRDLFKS